MKKINLKSSAMAAVLAGTMAFSMVPATAFATVLLPSATVTSNAAGVTKDWTVASEAQYSASQSFSFDLTYVGAENGGYSGSQSLTYNGAAPATDTVLKTVEVGNLAKKSGLTYEGTISQKDLFSGFKFDTPGVYHFQLSEKTSDNKNVVTDTETYDVYVNVAWAEGSIEQPEVKSVVFKKATGAKTDSAEFDNTAKANHKLTISKKVAGTAANTDDEFTFSLTVSNATGTYNVVKDGETTTLEAGKAYTFTLKHGEQIEVQNLPEGATYTVTETNTKDYDSTDVADEDSTTAATVTNGEGTPTGKGTIATEDDTVTFTNNKGFAPQTGVTMNMLPGIAIAVVAVAGGATLVIRRRNRSGQDF